MTTNRVHRVLQYLGLKEDAPRNEVEKAWRLLGKDTRRQVTRLARHRKTHPDPQVSSVALAWARQKRSQLWTDLAITGVVVVVCVVLALLLSHWIHWAGWSAGAIGGAAGVSGSLLGQHWTAKRVDTANQ